MGLTTPTLDTCARCLGIIKSIESCPSWDIIEKGEFIHAFLQIVWFVASMSFPVVLLLIVIYSAIRKSTRGFHILLNIGIQQMLIFILKKIIAQPRPHDACTTSSGFPSGHAAFASGMDTWFILEIIFFSKEAMFRKSKFGAWTRNLFMLLSPLVPASRYFLKYHTLEQILAGTGVGILSSVMFFGLCFRFKAKDYEPLLPKVISFFNRYRKVDMRAKPHIVPQEQAKEPTKEEPVKEEHTKEEPAKEEPAHHPIEILGA